MANQENSFIHPDTLLREAGLRAEQIFVHLGCGPGFYLIPAARIVGNGGQAIGIDVRPDMLAETENVANREGLSNIKTIRANLENAPGSPLKDKSSDVVLVANILHQSDPGKILKEADRIMAANGHIVIIEWDTSASPLGPPASSRIARSEVEEVVTAIGLKIGKTLQPSPYHYGFVVSK